MAYVNHIDAPHYPNLVAFMTNDFSKVPQNKKVFAAFLVYAEYSTFTGKSVFWSFMNPIIQIEPLKDAWAAFRPESRWNIYVDKSWALRFEKDVLQPQLTAKAKLFMEACLLHEMCHRGDNVDGVKQTLEAGLEFEKAAYGQVQVPYWT
jgi:hypothetical protein